MCGFVVFITNLLLSESVVPVYRSTDRGPDKAGTLQMSIRTDRRPLSTSGFANAVFHYHINKRCPIQNIRTKALFGTTIARDARQYGRYLYTLEIPDDAVLIITNTSDSLTDMGDGELHAEYGIGRAHFGTIFREAIPKEQVHVAMGEWIYAAEELGIVSDNNAGNVERNVRALATAAIRGAKLDEELIEVLATTYLRVSGEVYSEYTITRGASALTPTSGEVIISGVPSINATIATKAGAA